MAEKVERYDFGRLPDGCIVHGFRLINAVGAQVELLELGAAVQAVRVPDRKGNIDNVVKSFPTVQARQKTVSCAGAICGPVANRIKGAAFTLNGHVYKLERNNGANHLHGGSTGFHRQLWQGVAEGERSVVFTLFRPNGQGGYPGDLKVSVRYTWDNRCRLTLDYQAISSEDTICNLTNHTYWNLSGADSGIHPWQQIIRVASNQYTEMQPDYLPTGRILISEPDMDLRQGKKIDTIMHSGSRQRQETEEMSQTYVISGNLEETAAVLISEQTGRRLQVYTSYPGVLVYSGFMEDGCHTGVALECQRYPDSMSHPSFPSIVLPGRKLYHETTIYELDII